MGKETPLQTALPPFLGISFNRSPFNHDATEVFIERTSTAALESFLPTPGRVYQFDLGDYRQTLHAKEVFIERTRTCDVGDYRQTLNRPIIRMNISLVMKNGLIAQSSKRPVRPPSIPVAYHTNPRSAPSSMILPKTLITYSTLPTTTVPITLYPFLLSPANHIKHPFIQATSRYPNFVPPIMVPTKP